MKPEQPKRPESPDTSRAGGRRHTTLLALGSATVISIYSAGFIRTRAAASEIESASQSRRQPAHERAANPDTVTTAVPALPEPSVAATAAPDTSARTNSPARVAPAKVAPLTVATTSPAPAATTDTTSRIPVSTPAPITPPVAVAPVDTPATPKVDTARAGWKDGTYSGWGTSRHGDIEATVEIRGGRIISANISQCRTRYSCSRIADLPPQVLSRQSAEVDYVSGATQSSDAYYYAVVEALKKAK